MAGIGIASSQASSPQQAKAPVGLPTAVPPPPSALRVEDMGGQPPAAAQGAQAGAPLAIQGAPGMPGLSPEQAADLQRQLDTIKKSQEAQQKALEQIDKDL